MRKTFCLLSFSILIVIMGYSRNLFGDSTGKDEIRGTGLSKIILLKQSIVRTAINEYQLWRTDSILRESDAPGVRKLKQYWRSVGKQMEESNLKDSLWQEHHPWSSAFISWVMSKAVGKRFKVSPNHAGYIVWARGNAQARKTNETFVAYDICDARSTWPEPGDLICKNRDGNNFTLATIRASDISHSDIVVEVDTLTKTITTIGGNLLNTVSRRVVRLDTDGFIDSSLTWQLMDNDRGNPEGSQSEFFAVVKLRKAR